MCETCGRGDPERMPVELHESLLADNDRTAGRNRERFSEHGVLAIHLMGSPGSGKTVLLEATARRLHGIRAAAVSGDLATDRDAERLREAGIPTESINTVSACHLDAAMVHHALRHRDLEGLDYFFVENVGNLAFPALCDLGQHSNVLVLAVTEGEDKPLKYPEMFRKADLVLLSKVDLLPHLDVDLAALEDALDRTMPVPRVIPVSARSGEGVDRWVEWLVERHREVAAAAPLPKAD